VNLDDYRAGLAAIPDLTPAEAKRAAADLRRILAEHERRTLVSVPSVPRRRPLPAILWTDLGGVLALVAGSM